MKNTQWLLSVFLFAFLLAACAENPTLIGGGQGPQGPQGPQGVQGPAGISPAAPTPDSAAQLVIDENAYRATVGLEPLVPGLVCNLYSVPQTTTGITAAANGGTAPVLTSLGSFAYLGSFNQPNASTSTGFNVLPTAIQAVFQNWFILKCTGQLVIGTDTEGFHGYSLSSDDGSNLYIDGGAPLINNDGLHGLNTVNGTKFLKYGIHTFELDYFEANGSEALILNDSGSLMSNANFYH